jgi:hypothetical protein
MEGTANALIGRFGNDRWFHVGPSWNGQNLTAQTAYPQLNVNDNNPHNGDPNQAWNVRIRVRRKDAAAAGIYV